MWLPTILVLVGSSAHHFLFISSPPPLPLSRPPLLSHNQRPPPQEQRLPQLRRGTCTHHVTIHAHTHSTLQVTIYVCSTQVLILPESALLFPLGKKELSSGIVALLCLVSMTVLNMYVYTPMSWWCCGPWRIAVVDCCGFSMWLGSILPCAHPSYATCLPSLPSSIPRDTQQQQTQQPVPTPSSTSVASSQSSSTTTSAPTESASASGVTSADGGSSEVIHNWQDSASRLGRKGCFY